MKTPRQKTTDPFGADPFEANEALRVGDAEPLAGYLAGLSEGLSLLAKSVYEPEDDQRLVDEKQAPKSDAPKKASLRQEDWDAFVDQFEQVRRESNEEEYIAFLDQFGKARREGNESEWDATWCRFEEILTEKDEEVWEASIDQFKKILREEAKEEDGKDWDASFHQFTRVLSAKDDQLIADYLRHASDIISKVSQALHSASGTHGQRLEFTGRRGRPVDQFQKSLKESHIRTELRLATLKFGKQDAAIAHLKDKKGWSRAAILRAKKAGQKPAKKTKSHK